MITPDQKKLAIKEAKELIKKLDDPMHSFAHVESVLKYAKMIANKHSEVDSDILEIAVWWHDVGRIYIDLGHPIKSSEMADETLNIIGLLKSDIENICLAIKSHGNRVKIAPTTIEGKILKDADKLDFLTVERWKTGIENHRSYEIEEGIKKIPEIGSKILSLPESKEIFQVIFKKLVEFLRAESDQFLVQYKPEIIKQWKVDL